MNYQHILLATDLLDKHIDVAERARVMAHNYQAKLSIAHVVESLPGYASGYSGVIDLEEELYEEAKVKLAEFAGSLNIPTQNQHLGSGNPKIVILDIAEEIEHINSPVFFSKVRKMLKQDTTDPHGSNIPKTDF